MSEGKDDSDFIPVVARTKFQKRFTVAPGTFHPIITADEAFRLQKIHNIDNLSNALMSTESIRLQKEGWRFLKVVKISTERTPPNSSTTEYQTIDIENEWKDKVLFSRKRKELPRKKEETIDSSDTNVFDILDNEDV